MPKQSAIARTAETGIITTSRTAAGGQSPSCARTSSSAAHGRMAFGTSNMMRRV